MNQLIPLQSQTIDGELQQTVNARELHAFLEVQTRFNDWIARRVKDYGFTENIDYVCLTQKRVTQTSEGKEGAAVEQVHYVSLDMAKELPKYILSEEATLQVLLKYSSEVRARFIVAFKEAREALNNIVKLKEIEKLLPEVSTDSSFVYIVKNMDTNNIKIGVSKDVYKRLETFRTGNDCQLELVYKSIICSNTFDLESKVHEEFKDFHVRGEWFRVSESKVIEYLEKARYILKGSVIDVSGNGMFKTDGEMAEL